MEYLLINYQFRKLSVVIFHAKPSLGWVCRGEMAYILINDLTPPLSKWYQWFYNVGNHHQPVDIWIECMHVFKFNLPVA